MTDDIVEQLRNAAPSILAMRDAANEIERLLGACKDKADLLKHAYGQIDHLREEFERLERAYQQLRETYINTYINTSMSQNTASNDEAKRDII